MRRVPTSGRIAWTALTVVGLALVGCTTSNGEDTPEGPVPDHSSPAKSTDTSEPPPFEAEIKGGPGASGDPAPAGGDQCIDKDDPVGSLNGARELPATDDCDEDYKEIVGVMKGAVDVDYYKLSASDEWGCSTNTEFEAQTAGTELCVFARCKDSTIDAVLGCIDGAEATDGDMKGCCAAAPGKATPDVDCSGWVDNDSADFVVKVRQVNGDKCLPYKVRYRY